MGIFIRKERDTTDSPPPLSNRKELELLKRKAQLMEPQPRKCEDWDYKGGLGGNPLRLLRVISLSGLPNASVVGQMRKPGFIKFRFAEQWKTLDRNVILFLVALLYTAFPEFL